MSACKHRFVSKRGEPTSCINCGRTPGEIERAAPKAVDVLGIIDEALAKVRQHGRPHAMRLEEARAHVAELLAADREYDEAHRVFKGLRDGVSTNGDVIDAMLALEKAAARRAAALAACGGGR